MFADESLREVKKVQFDVRRLLVSSIKRRVKIDCNLLPETKKWRIKKSSM